MQFRETLFTTFHSILCIDLFVIVVDAIRIIGIMNDMHNNILIFAQVYKFTNAIQMQYYTVYAITNINILHGIDRRLSTKLSHI